jgi:guanine deaminase
MSEPEVIRAALFHTPANPFSAEDALVAHEDGALVIRDGRVADSGDYHTVHAAWPHASTTDWRGGVLLPGLVDTHTHFPQLRIIGARGLSLLEWLDRVALPEEARMRDVVYAAETARSFIGALAAHGTTTALVFGAHFVDATAALFHAAADAGLRIASGLVLSDRNLRPELHQSPADAYDGSAALIRRFHRRGRLLYAVTPRFALSTSEAMLEVCRTLLHEYPDVRVQTHIIENTREVAECARLFPWASDYLAVYERYGIGGRRAVMAHNVHPTDAELERLAAAQTSIAHCPSSNEALGSGIFSLRRHVDAGVPCALGTDVGAGTGVGILKEAHQAHVTQRIAANGSILDAARMLYLSTLAGAGALGLDDEVGDFRAGKAADLVYVRPPDGSVLADMLARAETPMEQLTAIFTRAGPESIREVRVEGEVVHRLP